MSTIKNVVSDKIPSSLRGNIGLKFWRFLCIIFSEVYPERRRFYANFCRNALGVEAGFQLFWKEEAYRLPGGRRRKVHIDVFYGRHMCQRGKKVLVSTTTHIFHPAERYARSAAEAEQLWARGDFAVIGTPVPEKGKLKMPDVDFLNEMMEKADVVFLEADGAKHYPCKVPKDGEPVLHPDSDQVIGVFGLSAIGKPLREACFRLEEAKQLLGVEEDHILTEEDAAEILSSPMGTGKDVGHRQYCVVLNQCDDGKRRKIGNEISQRLALLGVSQVVMTAFDPEERAMYDKMARGER